MWASKAFHLDPWTAGFALDAGKLESGLGGAAGLSSVDFRIVFLPLIIHSCRVCPLASLICAKRTRDVRSNLGLSNSSRSVFGGLHALFP